MSIRDVFPERLSTVSTGLDVTVVCPFRYALLMAELTFCRVLTIEAEPMVRVLRTGTGLVLIRSLSKPLGLRHRCNGVSRCSLEESTDLMESSVGARASEQATAAARNQCLHPLCNGVEGVGKSMTEGQAGTGLKLVGQLTPPHGHALSVWRRGCLSVRRSSYPFYSFESCIQTLFAMQRESGSL